MAKRLSNSQSNTILNYFQTPKGNKPNKEPDKATTHHSDIDDEVITVKKKRNRFLISDSESDSENEVPKQTPKKTKKSTDTTKSTQAKSDSENEVPKQTPKKFKKSTNTTESKQTESDIENEVPKPTPNKAKKSTNTTKSKQSDATESSLKAFAFGSEPVSTESLKPPPIPANIEAEQEGKKWLHEKLPFLQPDKIRDIKNRKPDHPDYDPRTLFVPDTYLNSCTPAMRQWWELKSQHYDSVLFFKVGKFYELYHMDATVGVDYLGFSYMRGEFAHSGFPEIAYGRMAASLIDQGFKVARVEQTETPDMMTARCKLGKSTKFDKVVKREICQVSTKGTCFYGAQLTDAKQPHTNYMTAIIEKMDGNARRFGICFVDTSIGTFHLSEFDDDRQCSRLLALIAQHPPALVLMERGRLSTETKEIVKIPFGNVRKEMLATDSQFYSASKLLRKLRAACYFKNENDEFQWPEGFKQFLHDDEAKPEYELALKSFGGCCWYLADSLLDLQVLSMGKFDKYDPIDAVKHTQKENQDYMVLDFITINNLQLLGGAGSLLKTIDYCTTAFGKRLLLQWISRPLCDVYKITERQKAVTELYDNPALLKGVRQLFSKLPDLERQITKIHGFGNRFCAKNHPDSRAILYENTTYNKRKILDLLNTLQAFEKVQILPDMFKNCESLMLRKLTQYQPKGIYLDLRATLEFFKHAFDHAHAKENGIIIPEKGVDANYDDSELNILSIKTELDEYLAAQCQLFKCRIVYYGSDKKRFQLEIPEKLCNKVTDDYMLEGAKKGSKPCRRYSTSVTRNLLAKMMKAEGERNKILQDLNRRIFEKFSNKGNEWSTIIYHLSILDCVCCLAEYARLYTEDICVPKVLPFSEQIICRIENGRHPCTRNVDNFVPNDTYLGIDKHAPIMILTGPNMGGKSTLMRQTVLICILAQMGSYVPASNCEVSIIDRVFTRLGAKDDILKNASTFLVELCEASLILQHATPHSFILLDELGRGTSTHDGNAIATAYVRKLCEINCRTIFSTHYHTLVNFFSAKREEIQIGYMACMVEHEGHPDKERVTFLYKLEEGACPKSYGFNVAKLAGLPFDIIKKARERASVLENISKNRKALSKLSKLTDIIDIRLHLLSLQ